MHKDKTKIIISIILILNLIIIVYLTSFNLNFSNSKFYKKEFQKYSIYEEFPNKDIDKINSDLLLYLKDKKESFDTELFDQKEINHLKDVKSLIRKTSIVYYSSLIFSIVLLIILFLFNKKEFTKNLSIVLFLGGLFTLLTTITMLALVWLNFNNAFTLFHQIFFPRGNYLFSPSENIIKLYPMEFFYDIAKNIFISIIFYGNILIGVGILLLKK